MAFPTTNMSGYTDLSDRITLALGRCQEQPWLDFKESQPWPTLRWRLLKTIMAMANLRDGGLILVGVAEKGTDWELTGIAQSDLATYDYDDIIDQTSKYASPQVNLDIVLHDHEDGNRYLAFHVHQFKESPVVCRNNSPDSLKPKERLTAGDVYVRPQTGKPQTVKVTDATRLHDLLELAAEFRARRMLEVGRRVGLVPSIAASEKFDDELSAILDLPVPITDFPYWQVVFRPEVYNPDRISSLTECMRLVEKTRVQYRGWDFPHLANNSGPGHEFLRGSQWIGSWANFLGSIEYWRMYQSGQFTHLSVLREATELEWKEKLHQSTKSHLCSRQDIPWGAIPGYVSLVNLVYTITEYFEFAARLSQAGLYQGSLEISLRLTNIKGYVLTTDTNRNWSQYCVANEDEFKKKWNVTTDALIADSLDHSLKAIVWLCECLGWMSPNVEAIRSDQQKLVKGRF